MFVICVLISFKLIFSLPFQKHQYNFTIPIEFYNNSISLLSNIFYHLPFYFCVDIPIHLDTMLHKRLLYQTICKLYQHGNIHHPSNSLSLPRFLYTAFLHLIQESYFWFFSFCIRCISHPYLDVNMDYCIHPKLSNRPRYNPD